MNSDFYADGTLLSPHEAAKRSIGDRLRYFQHVKLSHPLLKSAIGAVRQIAGPGSPTNLILVVGPTGVGKTTLGRFVVDTMIADASDQMARNPSLMPAVMWESPLASEKFSFGEWYMQGSKTLLAPLSNKAVTTRVEDGGVYVGRSSTPSVTALRNVLIAAAKGVNAQLAVIDEAAHMLVGAKGESLIARVNALKSLSNSTEMRIALLGSYDLYNLVGVTGQLTRRIEVVHFARYRRGKDAVVLETRAGKIRTRPQELVFHEFCKKLATYLPLEEPFDVVPYLDDLMDACLGTPGIYKDVLHRALTKAICDGSSSIRRAHLERSILTKKQRSTILEEILRGEALIEDGLYESAGFNDLAGQPGVEAKRRVA